MQTKVNMAIRILSSKSIFLRSFVTTLKFSSGALQHYLRLPPSPPDIVNDVSRVLSDHRNPHDDLEHSLNTFSTHVSTTTVEQVLKRCKNLGFSAHRFFLWAKTIPGFQHSVESYHILVDVLGSSKQFAILWDLLIDMRESKCCEISPQIFRIVFRAYSRANLPRDAIRAFNRMIEFGIKPGGWGDVGDGNQARKVFDEMLETKCLVDVLAYNSYLEALCKGGNSDEAYKIFRGMPSNGIEPDACTYSVFIRAYCEANDIHSVFRVLDRMRKCSLLPNVFTYNCIIKKLLKNEKVEEAYELLDEMIEYGVKPDAWSYNAVLAFHCDHSEVNRALKLLSRMENDNCVPDRHSYNMVLKLLIRIGRFDRMAAVWGEYVSERVLSFCFNLFCHDHGLCKKKGKLEEACKYFEMMVDEGIPPYSSTVEMLRNRLLGLGLLEQMRYLLVKWNEVLLAQYKSLQMP
ncbi:hypothetical protein F8388_027046 [Cannabis sativa]|uniref:Pentatricopeptide repeat-containing protein n=1 Tax=Cannabis sativa TaxID=3483 RepID=A0A7J6FNS4_CANSA|nr:hypothetical protein F8388_027046 [Cannabis sativa]